VRSETGQGTVEYALVMTVVLALALSAFQVLKPILNRMGPILEEQIGATFFPKSGEAFHQLRVR
jgi:hypothetical protein